jgi:hypothetical protein
VAPRRWPIDQQGRLTRFSTPYCVPVSDAVPRFAQLVIDRVDAGINAELWRQNIGLENTDSKDKKPKYIVKK